jgi:hypothetical protein
MRSSAFIVACLAVSAYACSERAPLDGKGCPCAEGEGYFCCEETGRCLRHGEACGSGAGGAGGSATAGGGATGSGGSPTGSGGSAGNPTGSDGGKGGTSVVADAGPTGGRGGAGGTEMLPPPPFCPYETTQEIEEKLIVPTCGRPGQGDTMMCHNGNFKPKLDVAGEIARVLIEIRPALNCSRDKLILKANWQQSFILRKANPDSENVTCADGRSDGMKRMPFKLPPLSRAEYECLRWYVYQLASQ